MASSETVTYAQNGEDLIINAFFKNMRKGFYIDVGANHPSIDSVTKYFYQRGWRGINIEPEPRNFRLLQQHRHRDINLQIGLSDKEGSLKMRQYMGYRSGLSTFSEEMKTEHGTNEDFIDVDVPVTTLKKVLDEQKVGKIDFMKIDVEGHEYNVLKSNDWKVYRPSLICIEANHMLKDWSKLLLDANYQEVFFDGLNKYYLADEAKNLLDGFSDSYVDNAILSDPIRAKWHEQIELKDRKIEELQADINILKTESLRLQRELIEQRRLASLAKQLVKSADAVVRHRIEKLNKPQKGQRNKVTDNSKLLDIKSKGELYKNIRLADFTNYYSLSYQKDRFSYRLVSRAYDSSSRLIFRSLKSSVGLAKRIKHARSRK
jgi:FkbM family methyltransferase